ncbi:hypothetical protein AKJ36_00180 [candidate division MSBL1 archaeon SCGC-AAA259I07]|uniref:Uncharacterized protein n=1 Tax=candidate division MSBL1 archaeon SCGC-AAA259I07 TaxID=1698266 RepID=A0A133UMZ7_9EURY|nr:hypothetical protein AKJ36_00180 [candidate division MSBL1 archaeon SCGC-AAA259I07]
MLAAGKIPSGCSLFGAESGETGYFLSPRESKQLKCLMVSPPKTELGIELGCRAGHGSAGPRKRSGNRWKG